MWGVGVVAALLCDLWHLEMFAAKQQPNQPAGRSATGIIHAHVLVRVRAGVLSYVCVCLCGSVCLCVYVLVWYT